MPDPRRLHRAALAVLLALAACTAPPAAGFRDPAAPIASTTRFAPERLAGDWQVVERFAAAGDPAGTAPERFAITLAGPERLTLSHDYMHCNDFECVDITEAKRAHLTGPGRLALELRPGRPAEVWLLWVDADYRVAAAGTPSGRFGWIMARDGAARADLMTAAREILGWYGYDMNKLREIVP